MNWQCIDQRFASWLVDVDVIKSNWKPTWMDDGIKKNCGKQNAWVEAMTNGTGEHR